VLVVSGASNVSAENDPVVRNALHYLRSRAAQSVTFADQMISWYSLSHERLDGRLDHFGRVVPSVNLPQHQRAFHERGVPIRK